MTDMFARLSPSIPFAAVVLAAGFSTRMQAFKPLLPLGDATSLVERAVRLFRGANVPHVVVVCGHRAEEVSDEAFRLGCLAARNTDPARGMFSSVQTGLALCREGYMARWTFMLPVDIPLVAPATVRTLMDRALQLENEADPEVEECPVCLVPCHKGVPGHPPLIHNQAIAPILNFAGDGGLAAAMKSLSLVHVEVDDPHLDTDLDTPEDYRQAQNWLETQQQPHQA